MSKVKKTLTIGGQTYTYYSLAAAKEQGLSDLDKLPKSLKILLENQLRNENGQNVTWQDAVEINNWVKTKSSDKEISYYPARVLMQDFTGVPAVVDLAALREGMVQLGGQASAINPLSQVDLVIDHSVSVEHFGSADAFEKNVEIEYKRNNERYNFLKWGQSAFENFRVVPPGTGIIHQVNLEYLADVVWAKEKNGELLAYPDTLVGTDSHTTMINALAVLGWGVGGIEAEAAMLGQPVTMLIPDVVGFKLTGNLPEGTTATDLVLTVVEMLRKHGVVGKFVEFFGPGMKGLPLADRATLANMAPEYGATCGLFPIDEATIDYLKLSGRKEETVALVERYAKEQGLWAYADGEDPVFSSVVELNMDDVVPCISGPKRPQDKIALKVAAAAFDGALATTFGIEKDEPVAVAGKDFDLKHGDVAIAAITSCTNTSNPSVMLAAGLVAKKACELGLRPRPWVKTSLAPGSKVVTDYLLKSGLQESLDALGFNLVGYGCTTCIGNSGPLASEISQAIRKGQLVATSVLSGNRNFEGRICPDIKANYLASPPLVVAYALAGTMKIDLTKDAVGKDKNGQDVFLKDIWPTTAEVAQVVAENLSKEMYRSRYKDVFKGDEKWQRVQSSVGEKFDWNPSSTYIRNPTFFENIGDVPLEHFEVRGASILALLGDSVTTDHISPAGSIAVDSPAGRYLKEHGVALADFNSYGSRRGNHEVMMRGTFANIRIKNEMLPGVEGGYTLHIPSGKQLSIYDGAMKYRETKTPLVIIAGKEYGTGSSRDWAAKGTFLQGVKAVITESFERIHRSNLIGMGVLPLQFKKGVTRKTLGLTGHEKISIKPQGTLAPQMTFTFTATRPDGKTLEAELLGRVDTADELAYFKNGGILQFVLRRIHSES